MQSDLARDDAAIPSDRDRRSPFVRLQRHARRLQWLAIALAAIVALLPPTIHMAFAVHQLQDETERHARHLALFVAAHAERTTTAALVSRTSAFLGQDGALDGLASFAILDTRGEAVLRIGDDSGRYRFARAAVPLPPNAAPLAAIHLVGDDRLLVRQFERVFLIHILVAAALAFAIYRLPIRSLRHAIDAVERSHVQLLHSAKLAAIGEIYAGLAHEINNPVGVILSRVGLMRTAHPDADLARDLEMIERHGQRIANTVRRLLAFVRKSSFELHPTDLNGVIHDAVALVEHPFAKQGVRVRTVFAAPLPRVRASRDHLQQVFLNLLTNARDAMPDGGTITIRTGAEGSTVVAEVEDGGAGMPEDVSARVFEPFFTTKGEGHGTGLGLSVSRSIVQAHGGEIAVASEAGRGTRFTLRLPVRGASA